MICDLEKVASPRWWDLEDQQEKIRAAPQIRPLGLEALVVQTWMRDLPWP